MNKKILMAVGLLAAGGLVGFQVYTGNIQIPGVSSLWTKPTPNATAKSFPAKPPAPDLMAAHPAPPDTPPDAPPDSPPNDGPGQVVGVIDAGALTQTPGTAGGSAKPLGDEEVTSRIGMAVELSKVLVATNGAGLVAAPSKPAAGAQTAAPAPYAGTWSGQFLGPDAGTVAVFVDENGVVQGDGVSTITGIGFSLVGKVTGAGKIEFSQTTSGGASTGATFIGALTKSGTASGTWSMADYNIKGTWDLAVNPE